ncbi:hypothetical protein [Acidovorax sp.]|uniref:hypothetical protein n=1 Tax=Acidovorax sp. TaxID=1872122 RepID=UPI00391D3930
MATTPFEELQAQAEAWCQEFEQYKEECKVFAERLRIDWIEYLGAKSTDVEFHKLDEHLDRIADGAFTLSPRLQVGDDGFVYFGLTLFFKMKKQCLDEHVRVGVQRVKGQWRVRWNQLEMAYGAAGSHDAFFQKATATIAQKFTTPFHRRRGPLGFVPIVSNEHLTLVAPADVRVADQHAAVGQATDGATAAAPATSGAPAVPAKK